MWSSPYSLAQTLSVSIDLSHSMKARILITGQEELLQLTNHVTAEQGNHDAADYELPIIEQCMTYSI